MLERVHAEHFRPLAGQCLEVRTPNGETLVLAVDGVTLQPLARMPDTPADRRIPFSVALTATQPTAFTDGLCTVALPVLGCVRDVWVTRAAPLGRDATRAYFQIVFT
jgi:hypothetical protein